MNVSDLLYAFCSSENEEPRLTTMLRAYTTERGSDLDVDSEFLKREAMLESEMANQSIVAPLSSSIFVDWDTSAGDFLLTKDLACILASQDAKDVYDVFLKSVAELLGGRPTSEELQECSKTVYRACDIEAPPLELLSERGALASLHSLKTSLKKSIGNIQDADLLSTVHAYYRLKARSDRELDICVDKSGLSGEEFGADLHFNDADDGDPMVTLMELCDITPAEILQRMEESVPKEDPHSKASVEQVISVFEGNRAKEDQNSDLSLFYQEEESRKDSSGVGLAWLQSWCEKASRSIQREHTDISLAVCSALLVNDSSDLFGNEIGDLIGWEQFDLIREVVENRSALKRAVTEAIQKARDAEEERKAPSHGTSFSINTVSEKKQKKKEQKDRRKAKGVIGTDLEWLLEVGFDAILATDKSNKIWLVDDDLISASGKTGKEGALPQGSTRRVLKGYEEIVIPAVKAKPPQGETFVQIRDLEPWAQSAFQGFKALNRIQSRIFPTAFNSNENLLVCAPTGAGKTNIALITILREIGQHMQHGVVQKSEFKIVYVAPMKALAAEMTSTFSKRLASLNLTVRELTGDIQLSKREMAETQMIVTTPEKWDVITRKGGDVNIVPLVRLLVLDEVEVSQIMIRIVGLSATLPNYKDVAQFLAVNVDTGLFYFDSSYRPVPLAMQFIGVTERNLVKRNGVMNQICFDKVVGALKNGKQAMVFVHSRKETGKIGRILAELSATNGMDSLFSCAEQETYSLAKREVQKSKNKELVQLFPSGIGIHHAGMLRSDRNLVERNFSKGMIKVLCCTATLAWGVNLPAHTVIIKGTQLYDSQQGKFTDIGLLDVQQIFGRAGRPQFDTSGEGIIITTHSKLADYLGMLTSQIPIESQFSDRLIDHLNAEIVLGTVSNIKEATVWLSYTYMHVRSLQNPLVYGITWETLVADRNLEEHRRDLAAKAAKELNRCHMARFDERSGQLYTTDLGRVASHYYINHESIEHFNQTMHSALTISEIIALISQSSEFENIMVREEELKELETLKLQCPYAVRTGEGPSEKVNILIQTFVSRETVEAFSLVADMMYVSQNAPRICRAIFEISLGRGWTTSSSTILDLCKALENQMWHHLHPLRQFGSMLPLSLVSKLEKKDIGLDELYELDQSEIQRLLNHPSAGITVKECLRMFPNLELDAHMHPITRSVVQVKLEIAPAFTWADKVHGQGQMKWLVWVEDSAQEHIYHQETWMLSKSAMKEEVHKISFAIPVFEPLPSHYVVRMISDSWIGAETSFPISFKSLILPGAMAAHTELLDLDPLPTTVLDNEIYQSLYSFTHFNPIQTQAFHTLYHTDKNVLLGAPTGSGKTISAELAMMRLFTHHPTKRVVYIAPLKALVRERLDDWGNKLCPILDKKLIELTGDYTPDIRSLSAADIIIATPEKWDGISRNWQSRSYVRRVGLMVIDEIHLLGADRGPIIEVIVSRMRYIASQMKTEIRILGLSTALANAPDVAEWMGVDEDGLFNFRPSVRPVPLECHIQGFSGKFYCPRMASMNKPAYAAIQTHSPKKPVLVFVSSRRQTRLTALDLIAFAAADQRPHQFLKLSEEEVAELLEHIKDQNLRHTLQFGIGMHHAGLNDRDRSIVERLFVEQRIQVLVATSTLAWGINTPTHLVIVKGTEYFDAPTRRYVDMPITDILQMMGRAGRPQYDAHGVAVIMVHELKKAFYKKFLYEPFPVESSLPEHVADHLNAEIVAGTIGSKQDALDYLTWTYFFRRLVRNPSFYSLGSTEAEAVSTFLSDMVESICYTLEKAGCIKVDEEEGKLEALTMGRIASFFYLKHQTMAMFTDNLSKDSDMRALMQILCHCAEYDELPVRHNEDKLNLLLAKEVRWDVDEASIGDPHIKTNLLLQAHLSRLPLPITDYVTDTKTALDNSVRLLQAMVDIVADAGWIQTVLRVMNFVQSLMQAQWFDSSPLLTVPHIDEKCLAALEGKGITDLPSLIRSVENKPESVTETLSPLIGDRSTEQAIEMCRRLPLVDVRFKVPVLGGESEEEGEYFLKLDLRCSRMRMTSQAVTTAFAPRFPKIKDESWWLVLGTSEELLALKRVSIPEKREASFKLRFSVSRDLLQEVMLYLMSDCYLGLDQEYKVFRS